MDTFQLQHFLGQLFSETSVEYSFAKFIDLLTVSSSLMSVYSHKKCNVLLICLAALNRVLSPAITSLEMTTGVEKGLRNLLCSLETYWSLHLANTIWWVYLWGTNKTNLCNCQNQNLTWNRNKWARLFLVCGLDSTCVYGGGRGRFLSGGPFSLRFYYHFFFIFVFVCLSVWLILCFFWGGGMFRGSGPLI